MATLTLWVALVAAVGLVGMLGVCWTLVDAVHVRGVGRILFVSLATLVLWVFLVMAYFLANSFDPELLDGPHSVVRDVIRLFFALYLVAQTFSTIGAVVRWRSEVAPWELTTREP